VDAKTTAGYLMRMKSRIIVSKECAVMRPSAIAHG
jgi:hypothetical protein